MVKEELALKIVWLLHVVKIARMSGTIANFSVCSPDVKTGGN